MLTLIILRITVDEFYFRCMMKQLVYTWPNLISLVRHLEVYNDDVQVFFVLLTEGTSVLVSQSFPLKSYLCFTWHIYDNRDHFLLAWYGTTAMSNARLTPHFESFSKDFLVVEVFIGFNHCVEKTIKMGSVFKFRFKLIK